MADNFFRVKNGLNLPTLAADPTVTPPTNSQPGDIAMYNGDLYIRGASTWSKALTGLIGTNELENDAVTTAKIENGAVTTDKITDLNVTTGKIAGNAVTDVKLANDAVTADKIASNAVTDVKINSGAVTNTKLADNAVTDVKVAAAAAIAGTKISPNFGAQNIQTTGSVSGTAFLGNAIGDSSTNTMKTLYGYARIATTGTTAIGAPGTQTIDCSLTHFKLIEGGSSATITLSNLAEGQTFVVVMVGNGFSYGLTWPNVKWPSGVVPIPTSNVNSWDIYTFTKIGGVIFGAVTKDMR